MVDDSSSESIEAYFEIFNLMEKKIFLNIIHYRSIVVVECMDLKTIVYILFYNDVHNW